MSQARSRTREKMRSSHGVQIAEFPLALFLALFFVFFPAVNILLIFAAQFGLQRLAIESVRCLAMSDTSKQAASREKELLKKFSNPLLNMFHTIKIESNAATPADKLSIVIIDRAGIAESFNIDNALPQGRQPHFNENASRLLYFYHLSVACTVYPIFNLSGIPLIGQLPAVGGPINLRVSADAPIENLGALDKD